MKKLRLVSCLWLLCTSLWAQIDDGAKINTASQTHQSRNYVLQVGIPYLGVNNGVHTTNPVDVRFPWDILYLYGTFSDDSFNVSKGYFGDKVLINWRLRNNQEEVTNLVLSRRIYTEDNSSTFEVVENIPPTDTTYEDLYVEGGVLYEYKLEAEGIRDIPERYNTFITGIGYRTPTAVVTGNISFEGGNPVKDVTVRATSEGSNFNIGSALNIPTNGGLELLAMNNPVTSATTLQAWIRPETAITSSSTVTNLFTLSSFDTNTLQVATSLDVASKQLSFNIAGGTYVIENFYPSGALNARGDDELDTIANFNTDFVHVSFVLQDGRTPLLYVNGRPMTEEYVAAVNEHLNLQQDYTGPYMAITVPSNTATLNIGGVTTEWEDITLGGGNDVLMDEIRVWNAALDDQTIRTDFRRLISGNDSRLIAYLRVDENVGQYAYDLSRNGFEYNKNHGLLWGTYTLEPNKVTWINGVGNIPTANQLGVLGVSDENGNYEISGIPYSGTGESFNITPLFGQHRFDPAQQLIFLGEGSEVVNKVDFVDVSSFVFKGKVLYDTRDVFPSFIAVDGSGIEGDTQISGPGILDEGYNYYQKGSEKFSKGEYWYNDNGTPDNDADDYLERYARIASEGVNVYIDGQIVLDENNVPVTSDAEGNFEISVPIGNHYITVKKDDHEFTYSGRFPAASGTYKEFFEDAVESVVFVDQSRVTLVGKVVGGAVEGQKEIGFGENGLHTTTIIKDDGTEEILNVSAKNNIGIANLTLDYKPVGGTVTDYTRFNFSTNEESGEYRVAVLPLSYEINQLTGLKIPSNPTLSLLSANEELNLSDNVQAITPEFTYQDVVLATGVPYHFKKSFVYRSTPVLRVTAQTSAETIELENSVTISTEGFVYPVYEQFRAYTISLSSFERYINKDSGADVEDVVPVVDGELLITNNLALEGTELVNVDADDPSITNYTFKAGLPTVSAPYTKTLNIKYRVNGVDYEAENYVNTGIILGGLSDGSQTFITAAPDTPDIILRDPPGSNSSASINAGETVSFTVDNKFGDNLGVAQNVKLMLGVKFAAGGGLAGPVIESQTTDNVNLGIKFEKSSVTGDKITKTYTFNQTISTSSSPEYVGAEGDLYIGQSKNYFYGSYDNIQSSATDITRDGSALELTNIDGESLFISKQKAMYFVEEPSETFFVYSQKQILESVIPELELIIQNLQDGIISSSDEGVLTEDEYVEQIRLWKKVIQENERVKYGVKNNRTTYREGLTTIIEDFNTQLQNQLDESDIDEGVRQELTDKLEDSNTIKNLLETNFEENLSFDAGVGSITRSIETSMVSDSSLDINVRLDENFAFEFGFQLNKMGVISTSTGFFAQNDTASFSESLSETTNISYTLSDNDPVNLLSIDVVNLYDGNGPVFSTIGGVSSCPYEPAELSHFYNHSTYDSNAATIPDLADDEREELSFATQKAEDPLISVEVASVSNIPESQKAEFVLKLENNSDFTTDAANFNFFQLKVDNKTNPHNAIINLSPNGNVVNVPYGEAVYYTLTLEKSVSDVYDYEDIRIALLSYCDPVNVGDDVFISAHFTPSCSEVAVTAPLDNWVYNMDTAYNNDGSTNPLNIDLTGFNTTFNSFQKIDLEYRLGTSPTWTRLHTYYTTQEYYDDATLAGESKISLISDATLSYGWDIAAAQLIDGQYEIRARSSCTNDTEFISEVISGTVDLNAPQRFGTPLPTDGILSSGEDLKVSFNETIFYNPAVSTIEIKGSTNQLPVDNNVSLYFEGVDNTAVISNPRITSGDLTVEFWMKNATTNSSATILQQEDGMQIALNNGELSFTLGGITTSGVIANDGLFHHYTFTHKNNTGEIAIYEEDTEVARTAGVANVSFSNNNAIVLGGNTFIGNIHSLRFWNKYLTLEEAYADRFNQLLGNESNLIGYWAMNEGRGAIAKDLARFKHASINADWDIKPKGNSYEFANQQYLELDNVDFVQLTDEMDATISFWIKTGVSQNATIFSNGKGDGTDIIQPNGKTNKWAINMNTDGTLSLASEGVNYALTNNSVADNNWHHVAVLFNRIGSLRTYVDAELVTSNEISDIGGFSGNKIWLGARGSKDLSGLETVDQTFTGNIDEFRLWNTLRNVAQITRDQYNEVNVESIGLMLYARMNTPDVATGNGPRYYHAYTNNTIIPSNAVLSTGMVNYADDVPAIKPERDLVKFEVSRVINDDEMIISPIITDWASLEGQILDITVHRMFDEANNIQESPITWTAFVKRNEVSWYADGYGAVVDVVKNDGEATAFDIVLVNRGGNGQPYTISNIPSWLHLERTTGTLEPDSSITITATIDEELSAGEYLENLYLETDFGFDEKLQVEVRALAASPDWTVNSDDFAYSMNIVGKIKIDDVLSVDPYDQIAAFVGDEIRGVAHLEYDETFQEYFAYVTVYSNVTSNENITFSIWDASQGLILQSSIDGESSLPFTQNIVVGSLSNAKIFENTGFIKQDIDFNQGWSWVSLNVTDADFTNINALTADMNLKTNDRILSHAPSELEVFTKNSGWSGSVSDNGGLSVHKMYKVQLKKAQTLEIEGTAINVSTWNFDIKMNWNWLPYPLTTNQLVNEALASFNAVNGDVIKSQNLFAIYDEQTGWRGTLNYMEAGKGYMIYSGSNQSFNYPTYLGRSQNRNFDATNEKMNAEFTKYPQNMNAVVALPEGYEELFVYDLQGVLKGIASNQKVEERELSFITIYGDIPETLVFHLGKENVQIATEYTFEFKSNAVLGTISEPVVIQLPEDSLLTDNKISIYPNPFNNEIVIAATNVESNRDVQIRLYSITGQLVYTEKGVFNAITNLLKVTPDIAKGMYLLQIETEDNIVNKRVIKK
ncbi:LamG-like jellyroll fold domain-containing protein [Tenacibaculum amylolyticum]|uniref:LamG-like jellyroll fold domain-containing protein n=1 Tax=Tenacibaculum amylolyticum TaxID=104269 RepID=UPI0038941F81